ncbi:arylamine N-acetyltransferase family protein [Paenibacillus baimaensis]
MHKQSNALSSEVLAYLDRIGYNGPMDTSLTMLSQLQECHLHTVPYENLDIVNHLPLSLAIPDLYDKIVVRHRGGYCFELNALFGWLLRELGYSVTDYFARFWRDEPNEPPKRRHHVLQVDVAESRYLCDVGVGGAVPCRPIQMTENLEHQQGDEYYQLQRDAYYGWELCEQKGDQWRRIYTFTEEPQLPKDYLMASYWCENAPDSPFTKEAKAAMRTAAGRHTLAGSEFRSFSENGVQIYIPQTQEEYAKALQTYFGIVIT